ncbi:lipopolysaccharide kinase InaA family protein [Bacteroides sp. GD17]|mgnify:CR=1 FL=1|jgi:hypothetical protein|uniref:lipopolysaccharide kinase InaA family protein n=1 Tax=Bacteroides sp. GD17 TaxID=3139826 RepID=UPI0025E3B790|nr:lipopolysaccharide kinase InaA family protein [uncultured Bacteroides sp.]
MKIHIHPHYTAYESFIRTIPSGEYEQEEIYCNRRNTVERVRFGDKEFVIKKYKRPALINCFIYTWIRKSKARRAFEYAELFLQRGIDTAFPVAYIEIKKNGFFHTGYFISEYIPYPLVADIYETEINEEEKQKLTNDLVSFTLQLHLHKIVPLDYNPRNIFCHKVDGNYHFALIDINRLKLGKVPGIRVSMNAFSQLNVQPEDFMKVVPQYAEKRGFDIEECIFFILYNRLRWRKKRDLKKYIKRKLHF